MVRINKVTTKTGDKGITTLAGGQKVKKSSLRIEAYGTLDELNSFLGVLIQLLCDIHILSELQKNILRIQNELFNLGSQLAVLPEDRREDTPQIKEDNLLILEQEIKEMNKNLEPLKSFILPGGDLISAHLHVVRSVCRRAERNIVRLNELDPLDGFEIRYMNRLSDWFFVAARYVCKLMGRTEILWKPS